MVADDGKGQMRSFLANDENFQVLKDLHDEESARAGRRQLRRERKRSAPSAATSASARATVAAFYLSNVEQYLSREHSWYSFCANVATLPLDSSSKFIRSVRNSTYGPGVGLDSELGDMPEEVKACAGSAAGLRLASFSSTSPSRLISSP